MTRIRTARSLVLGLALASGAAFPGLAQSEMAPSRTGTGGGPASTITAPHTNSLGVTKPPGTSLGPAETPSSRELSEQRATTNRIERSICIGCN